MTEEQKAEEIANKRCHEIGCFGHCNFSSPKHHRCGEWHREYNCALDGYHEGFKDCAKSRLNVTTISDCPIKDDWHYVKDGDYPKDNKPVLCILGNIDLENCEVGYYNDVGSGEPWHFETYHLPDNDGDNAWGVSAWKEIVLPELPKESE